MKPTKAFWLLALLCSMLLAACDNSAPTGSTNNPPPDAPPANTPRFTDPATPIQVKPGDWFSIGVKENASVGTSVTLVKKGLDTTLLFPYGDSFVPDNPTPMPGSGGTRVWTFKALTAGNTKISFNINQANPSIKPSQETFTVNVAQ